MDKHMYAETTVGAEIEDLYTLLEDLDITESTEAAAEKAFEDEVVVDLDLTDRDVGKGPLRALDADRAGEQIFAGRESGLDEVDKPAPAVKKAKAPEQPKGSCVPRSLASIAPEVFVLEGDVNGMSNEDKAVARQATIRLTPKQKKIAKKFENLFYSLAAGRKPSVYVTIAFKLLDAQGTTGSSDLIAAYKTVGAKSATQGYDHGTAASQTGQIMTLFEATKIATRVKNQLTLNPGSVVAQRLRAVV